MKYIKSLLAALILCPLGSFASEWGSFSGNPRVELLESRLVVLLENFSYTDPKEDVWQCPKDWQVDGASIPKPFWSVIGGPLDGEYRNASIIHDYACDVKKRSWKATHRAFYDAMRCGGVAPAKAKLMYWAVYNFGPRWGVGNKIGSIFTDSEKERKDALSGISEEEVGAMLKYIEDADPSLEALENGLII